MHLGRLSAITLLLPLSLSACSGDSDDEGPDPVAAAGTTGVAGGGGDGSAGAAGAGGEGGGGEPLTAPASANPALTGVEVPGADCPESTLPEFDALTDNAFLPDPFVMQNGAPVTNQAQWACRHRELRSSFEKYETGAKTEKPAVVTGAFADGTLSVTVSDGADRTATFDVTITYPAAGTAPYPAMIGLNGLLTIAAAYASWHLFEKHFLKLKRFFPAA